MTIVKYCEMEYMPVILDTNTVQLLHRLLMQPDDSPDCLPHAHFPSHFAHFRVPGFVLPRL